LRHGNGDFYYKSGKYYKGEWSNGKKEGFGKILGPDGKLIQKGIYRNDIFDHVQSDNFDKK
jgi:antitoxin component YwqK of YwqJK toxin-antitoxin module